MTLNDGHVFCAPEHVEAEIASILQMVDEAYRALSIPPPRLRFSRGGEGIKYARDPVAWEQGERMIRAVLDGIGADYSEALDEAAFYGPKLDLQVTDPQGREETLSTIQVDLHLPTRFELAFRRGDVAERPVIVHRSIVSTLERMVAHLLEVHDGALPVWLAPIQALILPVGDGADGGPQRLLAVPPPGQGRFRRGHAAFSAIHRLRHCPGSAMVVTRIPLAPIRTARVPCPVLMVARRISRPSRCAAG